ncbi:MAG: hypothetical protein JO213_01100 [Alphaproteobacteria bacterium]|nr:hypothetical protein [Alphaproteobacteria bacterium]MBV9583466.1 hypothetical protein [Alphaproteobacteria bacterium]MBV9966922.1 hypothetical protein [Alphaproteobacteria bacterium]
MTRQHAGRAVLLGLAGMLALVASWAPAASQSPGFVPAVGARIWFYHDLNPYESLGTPFVRIDGAVAGASEPGSAFYRDLPPGRHRLSVDSYVNDKYQTIEVDAGPGSEVFVKVVPNDTYVEGGGEHSGGYHRNSYVLWPFPAEAARPAIARLRLVAGGPVAAASQ